MTPKSLPALWIAFCSVLLWEAEANGYTYNVGPNWVNSSAAACRTFSHTHDVLVVRSVGEIRVRSGAGTNVSLFCPIDRRNTTFYSAYKQSPAIQNRELFVNVQSVVVRAEDAGAGNLFCRVFGTNKDTGSVTFGNTKYLCGTGGGCSNAPTSYSGTNTISLTLPSFSNVKTVSFGYWCSVPPSSKVFRAEASITPNN